MINLLPQIEKRKLRKEFYQRYIVVVLLVVLLCEGLLFFSLAPSYLALHASVAGLTETLTEKKKQVLPGGDEAQNELNVIKAEITLLKQGSGTPAIPVSELINTVLAQKPVGVIVRRFAYLQDGHTTSVQIGGVGNTREGLILFQKLLSNKEANPHFSEVKYAQGFLLRKTDIDFILSMNIN